MADWDFADMYALDEEKESKPQVLDDVVSEDWRNILVVGRASNRTVFPETLALIGHARELADELGCRVEVLLVGTDIQGAVDTVKKYPIDTVYTVAAPDYTSIQQTSQIIAEVVRKRRPELILLFQSRSGDAVASYAASMLGVSHCLGVRKVQLDTTTRRAQVTHQGSKKGFQLISRLLDVPQFVTIQAASFRAPIEDPYRNPRLHVLDFEVPASKGIEVREKLAPSVADIGHAPIVVVVGGRVRTKEDVAKARELAKAFKAPLVITPGVADRGLASDDDIVLSKWDQHIAPKLVLAVGCRGSLDLLESIEGKPLMVAIGAGSHDPIRAHSTYVVEGTIAEAIDSMIKAL